MIEAEQPPVQEEASAGTLLRRARESAGLHVAALAVALKVPVRKLEALEEDRYADLGDPVFIRGLASSVCRTLKADPQPILSRLPQSAAPRLVGDTGLNAPFRAPGDGPAPRWVDRLRQPVPALVLLLLLGAVVIYFVPVTRHDEPPAAAAAPAPVAASPTPAALEPAPSASGSVAPAAGTSIPTAAPEAAPAQVPAPAPPVQAAASAPAALPAAAPSAAADGIVVLRTKGESWVEVLDGKGGVVLRKLMAAGESAGASGALPLTVTIGKVDLTEVEVRGRKFDLRPVSKDNVARFSVK